MEGVISKLFLAWSRRIAMASGGHGSQVSSSSMIVAIILLITAST